MVCFAARPLVAIHVNAIAVQAAFCLLYSPSYNSNLSIGEPYGSVTIKTNMSCEFSLFSISKVLKQVGIGHDSAEVLRIAICNQCNAKSRECT